MTNVDVVQVAWLGCTDQSTVNGSCLSLDDPWYFNEREVFSIGAISHDPSSIPGDENHELAWQSTPKQLQASTPFPLAEHEYGRPCVPRPRTKGTSRPYDSKQISASYRSASPPRRHASDHNWPSMYYTGLNESDVEFNHNNCAECFQKHDKFQALEQHGKETGHLPFQCSEPGCTTRLSRRDTLLRHMTKHGEPRFECQWCSKLCTRRDHWKKHLSRCPHRDVNARLPASDCAYGNRRRDRSMSSSGKGSSDDDAQRRKKKLTEFMSQWVDDEQLKAFQRGLACLDHSKTQGLCKSMAQTVLDQTIPRAFGTVQDRERYD